MRVGETRNTNDRDVKQLSCCNGEDKRKEWKLNRHRILNLRTGLVGVWYFSSGEGVYVLGCEEHEELEVHGNGIRCWSNRLAWREEEYERTVWREK